MKTTLALVLAMFVLAPLRAEIFRPGTVGGALLGGIAGAAIGNNSGDHNGTRGAVIGTVAGALIGSALDNSNERETYPSRTRSHYYRDYPYEPSYGYYAYGHDGYYGGARGHRYGYDLGYRYGHHHRHPGYYSSISYGPGYYRGGSSYASSGFWLGGVTGAIIGNNSRSHNAWRGAAIGAGAGVILGSVLDERARLREAREAAAYEAALEASLARSADEETNSSASSPSPVSSTPDALAAVRTAPASPMAAANGLFGR